MCTHKLTKSLPNAESFPCPKPVLLQSFSFSLTYTSRASALPSTFIPNLPSSHLHLGPCHQLLLYSPLPPFPYSQLLVLCSEPPMSSPLTREKVKVPTVAIRPHVKTSTFLFTSVLYPRPLELAHSGTRAVPQTSQALA